MMLGLTLDGREMLYCSVPSYNERGNSYSQVDGRRRPHMLSVGRGSRKSLAVRVA